tara:strand:- start:1409 stop:2350 length:942 start_codon:yes stop_codon:yes gene_type:complete
MGLYLSNSATYYDSNGSDNDGIYGHYRYISLEEVINAFEATYVGEGKLCNNVLQNDITFHATRAMQELAYDTLICTKSVEFQVPSTLVYVMPNNYINYVSVSWTDTNGILRRLYPTSKSGNPFKINDTIASHGGLDDGDSDGYNETADSDNNYISQTADGFRSQSASSGVGNLDADEFDNIYGNITGERYGIDPQYAQANGTFFIDEVKGKFHFSSNISGKTVVLKYLSGGLQTSTTGVQFAQTLVPKLAEEAIYKHILYGVLSARVDTNPGMLALIKKERFAETRKAKLRLSNIKLEELTQVLRGSSKIIKH